MPRLEVLSHSAAIEQTKEREREREREEEEKEEEEEEEEEGEREREGVRLSVSCRQREIGRMKAIGSRHRQRWRSSASKALARTQLQPGTPCALPKKGSCSVAHYLRRLRYSTSTERSYSIVFGI